MLSCRKIFVGPRPKKVSFQTVYSVSLFKTSTIEKYRAGKEFLGLLAFILYVDVES